MSHPPFILIGNAENRRVTLFQQALADCGEPPATVVPWLDFLNDPETLAAVPHAEALVRIDSAGESFEVERALLIRGYSEAARLPCSSIPPARVRALTHDKGRILCPRQHHLGFLAALRQLEALFAQRRGWTVLSEPAAIADLFDKRITSRRYEALGVPVPARVDGVDTPAALRDAVTRAGCGAAYVKLSCGSSASCLALYELNDGQESLLTSIEVARTGWYNNLNVRRITRPARVAEVLEFLLREGSQVEQSVPKATLDGAPFDCRVLTISGEPAFTVVRQSRHPITNLHLGGWRGDPAALAAAAPSEVVDAAMESCRRVAGAHDCLHVGVDLMYESGFAGHRVLEANAFGDLLPGLQREGQSVYQWEIREALRRHARQ